MSRFSFSIVIALSATSIAWGHGVQVQVTHNAATGKIETREVVHTGTRPDAVSNLTRVYVMPLMSQSGGAGDGWYTRPDDERNAFNVPLYPTGPGVCYQYESQLSGTGWSFSGSSTQPNLQNTNFGYQILDGLKQWNGGGFVDPGTEQMQLFRGDGTSVPSIVTSTSDAGPFGTLALSNIGSLSSNAHSSVGFRLLGDGVSPGLSGATAGDDGVYLLSLSLYSTAAGVGASDPFYFVMYKNASLAAAMDAAGSLGFDPAQVQVLPEPASISLLAVAGLLVIRRRRA